jgi:hypothetical protein
MRNVGGFDKGKSFYFSKKFLTVRLLIQSRLQRCVLSAHPRLETLSQRGSSAVEKWISDYHQSDEYRQPTSGNLIVAGDGPAAALAFAKGTHERLTRRCGSFGRKHATPPNPSPLPQVLAQSIGSMSNHNPNDAAARVQ